MLRKHKVSLFRRFAKFYYYSSLALPCLVFNWHVVAMMAFRNQYYRHHVNQRFFGHVPFCVSAGVGVGLCVRESSDVSWMINGTLSQWDIKTIRDQFVVKTAYFKLYTYMVPNRMRRLEEGLATYFTCYDKGDGSGPEHERHNKAAAKSTTGEMVQKVKTFQLDLCE